LVRRSRDINQSRRLLSLAAVRDEMDRGSEARIGGMDRQTLRDWVHRSNASGPEGLIDSRPGFSHMSARPRHPAQDERIVEAFKNVWPVPSARGVVEIGR
jgi:hypothetical protein